MVYEAKFVVTVCTGLDVLGEGSTDYCHCRDCK